MNRPKKNKANDPLLPETQETDEATLIDVEGSAELSFEEKVHMYWMENKGFVIGCIGALVIAIVLLNGMSMLKNRSEMKLKDGYSQAITDETLEDFAKDNSDKDLGGFAALRAADTAFGAEDFAKATELYQLAAKALQNPYLSGRSKLGHAFALHASGSKEDALSALNSLWADSTLPEAIRAEAAYHLAVDADVAGNTEGYESYAAQIRDTEASGPWLQRLEEYAQSR